MALELVYGNSVEENETSLEDGFLATDRQSGYIPDAAKVEVLNHHP